MNDSQPPPDDRPTLAKDDRRTRPYPQSPYEQVPYQQPFQQPGFGPPAYPGPPGPGFAPGHPLPPKHPSATTAMVLGIVALGGGLMCGLPLVVAPWAWVTGGRAVREIDASGGTLGGRGDAQAGYVMGIVGTVLLVLGSLFVLLYVILVIGLFAGFLGVLSST
ncbi:DUF4190 domain-containing protein [uncultured Nocardioides sp.]|uniref:DUF4190 domain-containing protein n=1 Tax=uncultured Nocardioides sp. TaxID=198441 RepID=UPI002631F7A7|nr:DUF4190 domain-containing protein [uncultured Nocardioides sp.]